jgi:hypothetical protein
MQIRILPFLCLLLCFHSYAQFGNVFSAGSAGNEAGRVIKTDASGNIYVAGYFSGTIQLGAGTSAGMFTVSSNGGTDVFLAKFDAAGNTVFAESFGGAGNDVLVLELDPSGNLLVGGNFQSTTDFDPTGAITNKTSAGGDDMYFAKYNSANGQLIFVQAVGGPGNDYIRAADFDAAGNIFIGGEVGYGTSDVDPGAGVYNLTNTSAYAAGNIFFGKYNSIGNLVWAKSFSGCCDAVSALKVDASGNLIITGGFQGGPVDFDPGAGYAGLSAAYYGDIFLAKYDNDGNYVWAKSVYGPYQSDWADAMALDNSGNIIIAGELGGASAVDYDFGAGTYYLTGNGLYDGVIAKYDTDGNIIWAKNFGGSGLEQVYSICTDASGNVYATGLFGSASVDFDPGAGVYTLSNSGSGTYDIFYLKLDNNGNFVAAGKAGGSDNDWGSSIALRQGSPIMTGYFSSNVLFGSSNFTAAGGSDLFITNMGSSILPLKLLSFAVKRENGIHLLEWSTANETGVKEFIVERSGDGVHFERTGIIKPEAAGASTHYYSYADRQPLKKNNYYRLKMVDLDGKTAYGPTRLIKADKLLSVEILSNPSFNKKFAIRLNSGDQLTQYRLISAEGKLIEQKPVTALVLQIQVPNSGIYFLHLVKAHGSSETEKLIAL